MTVLKPFAVLLGLSGLAPSTALAQQSEPQTCPPGWYCEPAQPHSEPSAPIDGIAAPQAVSRSVQDDAPARIRLPKVALPPPRPKPWRLFGAGARVALPLLDRRAGADGGALGAGLSFRYRPTRVLALEAALDGFRGTGYQGDFRSEAASSVSVLLTPDVRRTLRPMVLAGAFVGAASVEPAESTLTNRKYTYLGMLLGFGLEFSLSGRVAFHSELLGFVRERVDGERNTQPEYVDPGTGRTTNVSAGGLLRAGVVVHF